jgi:hypothetical protein
MKKQMITLFAIAMLTAGKAQDNQVKYTVVENDPSVVRNKYIALEFLNADIGANSNVNTVGVGANGIWSLSDKLGLDARFHYVIFKVDELPACFQFQAGGFYSMSSSVSQKDIKARFGGKSEVVENKHVQTENYIVVPANIQKEHALRGGLYLYKKGYKDQGINMKPEIPYLLGGVYAGYCLNKKTNLVLQFQKTEGGIKVPEKPQVYRGYTRIYFDAIVTPLATRDYNEAILESSSAVKNKLLGARLGFLFYTDGPKVLQRFMYGVETGIRPIDGFYFNASVGYTVFRGK